MQTPNLNNRFKAKKKKRSASPQAFKRNWIIWEHLIRSVRAATIQAILFILEHQAKFYSLSARFGVLNVVKVSESNSELKFGRFVSVSLSQKIKKIISKENATRPSFGNHTQQENSCNVSAVKKWKRATGLGYIARITRVQNEHVSYIYISIYLCTYI